MSFDQASWRHPTYQQQYFGELLSKFWGKVISRLEFCIWSRLLIKMQVGDPLLSASDVNVLGKMVLLVQVSPLLSPPAPRGLQNQALEVPETLGREERRKAAEEKKKQDEWKWMEREPAEDRGNSTLNSIPAFLWTSADEESFLCCVEKRAKWRRDKDSFRCTRSPKIYLPSFLILVLTPGYGLPKWGADQEEDTA